MATRDVSDPAGLSLEELEGELATLAAHIAVGMCRWLELVGELDRRGSWGWRSGSCAQFLAWRCALLPRTAREHVRVARRLPELPLTHAAFSRGELSFAKVRALTRVARPDSEEALLELARVMTASQLERALRAYRRVTSEEARSVQENEQLTAYWDEDGSLVVRGRLAPDQGALFLRALEASRDALWEHERQVGRGSAEPQREPRRPTNTEALAAMADVALASRGKRSGGERYQVVVRVDETVLTSQGEEGCELEGGPAIAAETARRLACDASLVRIRERNGKPLSVGRKTRAIPPALRRALSARDRGCRFPGCDNRRFVDAHHVRHWAKGGETALRNLVSLCRRHHRLVHEGGYAVDERMRFYDPRGRPIPPVPRPPPGNLGALLARGTSAIGPKTCATGPGDRMDLALAVEAIAAACGGSPFRTHDDSELS
jgi:hypothetical protein